MHRIPLVRWIPAGALKTTIRCLALALVCAMPAAAQQQQLRAEWGTNVTEYRGQNDRRVTLVCPPGRAVGEVWGTDSYTDDSSVCSAAVHAGVIGLAKGGVVTIVIGPGNGAYTGSTRNGVTSQSFGKVPGSFSFERGTVAGQVDWMTSAKGISLAGGPVTVVCPPGGKSRSVWGTDRYTDDSSICTAAVHAGRIRFEAGGRVTISDAGAQASYAASERNGVSSQGFADWPTSFQVSAPAAVQPSSPLRQAPIAAAPRGTIEREPVTGTAERTGTAPISRAATSITLSVTSMALEQGATQEITATTDTREVGPAITWQSSNAGVASVNSDGVVSGVEVGGPVTIAATSGAASATATVTVSAIPQDPGGGATYTSAVIPGTVSPGASRTIRGYFASTNDRDRWYKVNVVWPQPSGCTAGISIGPVFSVSLTGIPEGSQYDLFLKKDHAVVLQEARPAGNQDRTVSVSGTCGTSSVSYYVQVHRTAGLPSRNGFTLRLAEGT